MPIAFPVASFRRCSFKRRQDKDPSVASMLISQPAEKGGFTQCKANASHKQADDHDNDWPFVVCIRFHMLAFPEFIA
jgi:inorganic pyrophosphatase